MTWNELMNAKMARHRNIVLIGFTNRLWDKEIYERFMNYVMI